MLKRPFCGMAVCFLLGILGAAYLNGDAWIWICAALLLTLGVWQAKRREGDVRRICFRICLCTIMLLLGQFRYQNEQIKRDSYLPALEDGSFLTVQGKVTEKQYQNNQYIYELTSCYLGSYQNKVAAQKPILCNRILAYSDSDVASVGEILVLNGTVKLWENAVNEGNFDAKSFYLARKIDFRLRDIEIVSRHGKASRLQESLFRLKLRMQTVYQNAMSEDACGVIVTMVLGDKTLLSAETKKLYQTAGLSHVMAISGLHISIIGMSLYHFLRKRGLGFKVSGVVSGTLICLYGMMVGMGTSVQRSIGMFLLLLLGEAAGRSYDSLNALGVLAVLLLWENPFLFWDAGFQFSFVAIVGVTWVGKCVSFEGESHKKIKEKIFVSGAVQMATLPLVAWNYYEIPLYAILVNLIVLPLMGSVLGLGIAGGFAGLVSVKGGAVLLFFCEQILALIRGLCALCAKLPHSMVIVGRPKLWQMALCYMVLILLTLYAYRQKDNTTFNTADKERTSKKQTQKRCERRRILRMSVSVLGLLLILLFPMPQKFEADILDVGQGDAIFVQTADAYTIFVDGGSSNVSQVGTYRILPFLKYNGVNKIDFWFVSHTDEDHVSGLRELLTEGYPIGQLAFVKGIVQDDVYQELRMLAEANGTQILYLTGGDTLHLGSANIHVLYPWIKNGISATAGLSDVMKNGTGAQKIDKNADSLVFWYEEGEFSAVLTGDIGSEQEEELCEVLKEAYRTGRITDKTLEFYKAAHHGSKNSNSMEWLALLEPQISVVSCAEKNSYGHPGEEAVLHMQEVGSEVFYTMESGQITVRMHKGELEVTQYIAESDLEFSSFAMLE